MTHSQHRAHGDHRRGPGRIAPLVWAGSLIATLLLTLGVNGTLSSWTSAVINNNTNTAATATAVILQETSGAVTCNSSDGTQTPVNSSTCTTINKYGGTTSPMIPGGSQVTVVTFKNVGGLNASKFTLASGTCSSTPTTGTLTPDNLCATATDFTIKIECPTGTTIYVPGTPNAITNPLTISSGLAAGASVSCTITAAVPPGASVLAQGVTVTQPLTWTLTQ